MSGEFYWNVLMDWQFAGLAFVVIGGVFALGMSLRDKQRQYMEWRRRVRRMSGKWPK